MIGIDLDGTILNYGSHVTECRINHNFLAQLKKSGVKKVAILTNQGGIARNESNPQQYPSPGRFVERLFVAIKALNDCGINVVVVCAAIFHPKATRHQIDGVYLELDSLTMNLPVVFSAVKDEEFRKPNAKMLTHFKVSAYYGDSPEDREAATNAGIQFHFVERFV